MTDVSDVSTVEPPLTPRLAGTTGARLLFTGRRCGNASLSVGEGEPVAVRAQALARIAASLDDAVFAAQVHAARVTRVGARERGAGARERGSAVAGTDALITTEAHVPVCVQVADCLPVALVATDQRGRARAVGAVHAGRAGIVAGVVGAAVAAIADAASVAPGRIAAVVGPGIGGCCYEVPGELAVEVGAVVPAARTRTRWGSAGLDLPAAARAQLVASGVQEIEAVGSCTRCHPERWFSHRATQDAAGAPGRQLLIASLDAPAGSDPAASLDFGP